MPQTRTALNSVRLDRSARTALHEQIYERIRLAIANRQLAPGERLPSARSLASQLGTARGTVDTAYARLTGEGYLLAHGQAGTTVAPMLRPDPAPRPGAPAKMPVSTDRADRILPFQMGLPALDLFPRALWARLTARAARRLAGPGLAYPDPAGLPSLREAIAAYLAVSRGVACQPEQVVITGGYQVALGILARLLLRPGDPVWFENPGYFLARRALEAADARPVPVPVDENGLCVDIARTHAPDARLAVVTPAHQSPTGVALSLPRRQALLAWAASAGAWIVEDDYDSEFHYVGRKLPALKSIDTADRVIYAGSFSKTLFPGLRLGYLVMPATLTGPMLAALDAGRRGEAVLGQSVAADFLAEGHFARHLRRMRTLYAARRQALATALEAAFGNRIELAPQAGGLSILMRLADGTDDAGLVRRARAHGLAPTALSGYFIGSASRRGLLLGFTNTPETEAVRHARTLMRAIL
ncbi:MAG TPA: PLP-dependent aminotransferase family protein [Acidiphilium sp.]